VKNFTPEGDVMGAKDPKELHVLFAKYHNAQDLDGLLSLYEDDAVLVAAPGAPVTGRDAIREALRGLLDMKGQIEFLAESEPVVSGELALTHGRWRIVVEGAEPMEAETAEVSRLDADGVWRYVLDNPFGSGVLSA
jgi:uncharacterized protein (TIGR02246 family)